MPDNVASEAAPPEAKSSVLSSVVALALGALLAVVVSAVFSVLGWGGEYASQIAGAMSGAAPLILDGARRRRSQVRRSDLAALSRGRVLLPRIMVASLFGFALLAVESAISLVVVNATQAVIDQSGGDQARFQAAYLLIGSVVVLPLTLLATVLLALAAGHRLRTHRKRWLLFGMAVYLVVRVASTLLSDPDTGIVGVGRALLLAGLVVSWPVLVGFALIGAAWARRTQAVFNATAFFRRLPEEDQEAALALLGDTVTARRSPPPAPRGWGRRPSWMRYGGDAVVSRRTA